MTAVAALRSRLSQSVVARLSPPPKLTVSEWADRERIVSSYSAEPGRWLTSRTPYLREIMDSACDPTVQMVVFMKCARIGGTEGGLNIVGYFIDQDPSPILIVQPTVDDAKDFSKEQLAPMLADTPALSGRVRDPKSRDSGNTLQSKMFPGGALYLVGANSPRGFRRRTARVLILEEVDGYPASAGTEGNPIALGKRRTATFGYRRKIYMNSTPTIKGVSEIEAAFNEGDQRRYYVPCPDCGHRQHLRWVNLRWTDLPQPLYACEGCGALIPEEAKFAMMLAGAWVPENPGAAARSYHINALYSPWVSWAELRDEFELAKHNPERLQVFINTALGETWEAGQAAIDPGSLEARAEVYGAKCPDGVRVITMGVDVQDDRLELTTTGYGLGEEQWTLAHDVILGDPETAAPWNDLEAMRTRLWAKADGTALKVDTCCIDSGAHTEAVYRYVKPRYARRVYATKGSSTPGAPLVSRKPTTNNKGRVRLFLVGTETVKDIVMSRLKTAVPGMHYAHFPTGLPPDYFDQLTSERVVRDNVNGRWIRRWKLDKRARGRDGRPIRNEALDCAVLCYVALVLSRVRPERLVIKSTGTENVSKSAEKIDTAPQDAVNSGEEPVKQAETPLESDQKPVNLLLQRALQKARGRPTKGRGWWKK